uniref:CSON003285 protein n=1 Tax=Culicoides sonorensis TaxID=179676 RepID=A0A336MLE4_CULSO
MSQINLNRNGTIARKRKRQNSDCENTHLSDKMWEELGLHVITEEENTENSNKLPVKLNSMENVNKKDDDVKEISDSKEEELDVTLENSKLVRCPLAPVSTNQKIVQQSKSDNSVVSLSSNSNNTANELFASNQDWFLYRTNRACFETKVDHFSRLSDEIILHIFKWLPKKALTRCCFVCTRFNKIVHTDILWTRLDLGGKSLKKGALGNVITRGVVILRLAQADIHEPIFDDEISNVDWEEYHSKLQYLDLSMATISESALELFLSKCRKLKKLSLEHVKINEDVLVEIGANSQIDSLNLTMCEGITQIGVQVIGIRLKNLRCLNISWTNLTQRALEIFVQYITPELLRLNIAGCRTTMTDQILAALVDRCPKLVELDISDCPKLTTEGLKVLLKLKSLEYLSISRCYTVDVPAFLTTFLKDSTSLLYLDVFGLIRDENLQVLAATFPKIGFNKFVHSSVARPTVGTRRTSIWGLRTRD